MPQLDEPNSPPEVGRMNALSLCDRQLNDLTRFLRERTDVDDVERSANFGPGPSVDLYVDAKLKSGEWVL